MIRSVFIHSLFVAAVLTHPIDSEGETFQYEAKCLNQSEFITDVDVNNVNGKFAFVGNDNQGKCVEITFSNATPEDIEIIKNRRDNFRKFPNAKWEQAVKKLTFSAGVSDTLIWRKENGEAFFLADDTDVVPVMFKKHSGSTLFILREGQGVYPIGIQVAKDVTAKCIAVDELIDSYIEEKLDLSFQVYNFC
ncbi:hypothetical protein O0L34_g11849 [Tuta absoluta]|nr:hypothetical protein O0L34_g11849 [Tuta absoluta]